jgi:signal transduction histidine kinase/CheY-like chemotaxis protein/HPt (histidine-containing phosphotransfer) domain-containing protein
VNTRFYSTLKGKVITATIVGFLSIYSIHSAIKYAFEEITENIDNLTTPNEKLKTLNRLFRDMSQLNQLQREEMVSGHRNPSLAFIKESDAVYFTLDTLKILFQEDSLQMHRLFDIEHLLNERERLFLRFLENQYRQSANPDIQQYLNHISHLLRQEVPEKSEEIVKKTEVTTTMTYTDTIREERPGFMQRLFGRGVSGDQPGIVKSETRVDEATVVSFDTIRVQNPDKLIEIMEYSIDSIRNYQIQQSNQMQNQELQLHTSSNILIHEIISIINTVEQEELARTNMGTTKALTVARTTISRLNVIVILFISASVILVLLIIIDISKSNNYRKQLEIAHAKAQHDAEAKQRFLSNMSHEIRTPLQAIYGYAEQERTSHGSDSGIEAIYSSAGHLLNVVNEVLDFAKVSSGKLTLSAKAFDPEKEIHEVVTAMRLLAAQKGLELYYNFNPDGQDLFLIGDAYRLRQIIYNIIGNAVKFTESGSVTVNVHLTKVKKEAKLSISIQDTGIGIAQEKLQHLFAEYSQSDPSITEKYGGTGLGLSIVKTLIDLQKGKVSVESTTGVGTNFTIFIPYKVSNEIHILENEGAFIAQDKPSMVWFADDDPLILRLATSIMHKHGIPCQDFKNGDQLLEAFKTRKPEVVFLDMRMPGLSGLEICRQLRKRSESSLPLKIYALTAQALPEEKQSLLDEGFDKVILKPFREYDILNALGQSASSGKKRINIENFLKMAGDDKEVILSILNSMLDESRSDLEVISKSLWRNDKQSLSLVVHRMAGRVGQTGAMEYAAQLRNVELAIINGVWSNEIKKMVKELLESGEVFISDLEKIIEAKIAS